MDYSPSEFSQLDNIVHNSSARAMQYERELKDLESKMSEHLSNSRTIDSSVRQVFSSIKRNAERADRAIDIHVPHVNRSMDDSIDTLSQLEHSLPRTRARVAEISVLYDSGRLKAQSLVNDLTWLTTSFHDRWRMIIFTSSSPVSFRAKLIMRLLFLISFTVCAYIVSITVKGAFKAHRHRLVWGDRLMS